MLDTRWHTFVVHNRGLFEPKFIGPARSGPSEIRPGPARITVANRSPTERLTIGLKV